MTGQQTAPLRAVVVEDSETLSMMYEHYLCDLDFSVECFDRVEPALESTLHRPPDLLLLDLELPDRHGLELLTELRRNNIGIPVIAMTGYGAMNSAVDAMRSGADDFLEKPFSADRLRVTVDNLLDRARMHTMVKVLEQEYHSNGFAGFVGRSLPMQAVYRSIETAASSNASVFITGESGTGKELCAEAIHKESLRSAGPFVAVNCGAIPKELFESEFFGHVKGAFTGAHRDREGYFEQAHNGTLFLDELGEMELDQQVKLLRVIQSGSVTRVGDTRERRVNVRIVSATNRDPWEMVQQNTFREDLFYRLNVMPIALPPLRERGDDVLLIAGHLLQKICSAENKNLSGFSAEAEALLLSQRWPGNVRELHNRIYQAALAARGQEVTAAEFGMLGDSSMGAPRTANAPAVSSPPSPPPTEPNTPQSSRRAMDIEPLWMVEKRAIEHAIEICDGNVPAAATFLEVSASTLYRKLKNWQEQGLSS